MVISQNTRSQWEYDIPNLRVVGSENGDFLKPFHAYLIRNNDLRIYRILNQRSEQNSLLLCHGGREMAEGGCLLKTCFKYFDK